MKYLINAILEMEDWVEADSPTDKGKEIYERLYNNRMVINI